MLLCSWPIRPFANTLWFKYHINLLNLKFFVFFYFHQHAINFCFAMLFFFLLLYLCYLKFESQKCMNKPLSSNSVGRLVLHFAVFFTQRLRNTPQYLTNFATYVFFLCSLCLVAWLRVYVLFVFLWSVFFDL